MANKQRIDNTQLDLLVVGGKTRLPLGRPFLTTCFDDSNRMVLGFQTSFEPPSFRSTSQLIKRMFHNGRQPGHAGVWESQ